MTKFETLNIGHEDQQQDENRGEEEEPDELSTAPILKLVGASNAKRMAEALKAEYEVVYVEKTSIEDTLLWAEELENQEPENEIILIHQGTRNLANKGTSMMITPQIQEICQKLNKNGHNYFIAQLPPTKLSDHVYRETIKLNAKLEEIVPQDKLTKTIEET